MENPAIQSFKGVSPQLGERVYVADSSRVIGDVVLGEDASVWPMAAVRGDVHEIRIGARTNVQDNAVLHCTHAGDYNPDGFPLIIGDDVTIGHAAVLHGCTIGNNVLVGMQALVLDGAVVPDNVILGAGCLVPPNKTLESGYLYIGSPAKKARALTQEEVERGLYGSNYYVKLKDQYLLEAES